MIYHGGIKAFNDVQTSVFVTLYINFWAFE